MQIGEKKSPDDCPWTRLQGSWVQRKAEESIQWKQQTFSKTHHLSVCMPLSATCIGDWKQIQLTFGTEEQTDKAKKSKILD